MCYMFESWVKILLFYSGINILQNWILGTFATFPFKFKSYGPEFYKSGKNSKSSS